MNRAPITISFADFIRYEGQPAGFFVGRADRSIIIPNMVTPEIWGRAMRSAYDLMIDPSLRTYPTSVWILPQQAKS